VGARLRLRLGGKTGQTSGDPLDVDAAVMAVVDEHGQHGFGTWMGFGSAAWVRLGEAIDVALVSERQQVLGPDAFTGLGIDLADKRAIVVKSAQHFRAGFDELAAAVIRVETPGALSHDFATLPYRKRDPNYWPRVADPQRNAA
jgi:microcystin degradation protein MlrC